MIIFSSLFVFILLCVLSFHVYTAFTFGLVCYLVARLLLKSRAIFAFREFTLLLYAINYLLSPCITYTLDQSLLSYPMKITADQYFSLAIPGFILFAIGLYSIKTNCFTLDLQIVKFSSVVNEALLKKLVFVGVLVKIMAFSVQGNLKFVFYLFGLLRFVGAFALFGINPNRYFLYTLIVLILDLCFGLIAGAYHDAIMWILFFGLFFVYTTKPTLSRILFLAFGTVIFIFSIQAIKAQYREKVWVQGEAGDFGTIVDVGSTELNSENLFGETNLLSTLSRSNQAWIFASTVDNMDRNKNFQGLNNVSRYLEAVFLPRFLAPNKITSGNQEIFNQFSGSYINNSTSMGLGLFADGYIAYGAPGVYFFGLALGIIFALTFKVVERWTKIAPFYMLLLLPLLNYAVRPDCELQTTLNHLFKSILFFGSFVYLTRYRFSLVSLYQK